MRHPLARVTIETWSSRIATQLAPHSQPPSPSRAEPVAEPDEVDALTLGRRIRDRRTARGMTLGELAAAIDRAPSQVSAIENGKREPRLSMLRTIALALGTTVDELLRARCPVRARGARDRRRARAARAGVRRRSGSSRSAWRRA